MKYVCLVYLEEQKLRDVPDRECLACGDDMRASNRLVAAEALQPSGSARTLRIRDGKVNVTDGPVEAKGTVERDSAGRLLTLDTATCPAARSV